MIDTGRPEKTLSVSHTPSSSSRRRVLKQLATGGVLGVAGRSGAGHDRPDTDRQHGEARFESGDERRQVRSVDEARDAVVRISTERTGGEYGDDPIPVDGSGFLIDASGIVVTNGHVVTGVDSLELFVGRAQASPAATVLGVSECADLAVLGITGEGYTPLTWYTDEPEPELDVWALGFPDGESYTTTDGSISRTTETANRWIAVDSEIEHTARLRGGHSGGPLVTVDGRTVGVNYAVSNPFTPVDETEQFAISATVTSTVVEEIRAGTATASIGIHGTAVPADDRSPAGVHVLAVESNGPASNATIQPGDVLTAIGNTHVGTGGTVREYCNVLDVHDSADELPIQVYRDGILLTGTLDGRPLEPVLGHPASAHARTDDPYPEYTTLTDETGTIWTDVPSEWADRRYRRTGLGPCLIAAPDVERFRKTIEAPGLLVLRSSDLEYGTDGVLGDRRYRDCPVTKLGPYDDGLYRGDSRSSTGCGDTRTATFFTVAEPRDQSFALVIYVQLATERDRAALERILAGLHHRTDGQPPLLPAEARVVSRVRDTQSPAP
ncbi:S1C family serine protease [Natronococcus sp. A-GB1]|uniref:S1C family serine protease n=1 Tax=Natronococcus sp. A-GB1 TaxID=3037648 RepID=UPI00242010E0|nr:S1C family serine protease [Natronococcus sp. A-GB1]MDG5758072.1 S1C family serine protease [Natronococcus sp. A-GB1]